MLKSCCWWSQRWQVCRSHLAARWKHWPAYWAKQLFDSHVLHCNQMHQMQCMNNSVLSWFSFSFRRVFGFVLSPSEAFGRNIASQSCQLFYFMTKLLLWQSLRSQCFVLLMNFILGFFGDRALTVDRMTWLSSPLKLKCWKRRLDFLRDFVAFFNLETLKPDRGLSAVTCQLKTCCKFNAQVSNRFVWEIPVIRGHWWSWEVVPALR